MAISWGSWVNNSSGNGMRLGYEFTQSPSSVGAGTSSVTVTVRVYVETRASVYDSSNSYSIGGSFSASGSVNISHGSGGGTTLIRTLSRTVSTSYSGNVSTSVSASLSGIAPISGTASVSGSHSTGRRPYSAPNAPSSVGATRTGSSIRVTWRNNPTTARPYQSLLLRRSVNGGAYTDVTTLSGTATSYSASGFSPNVSVRYAVRAQNSAGNSVFAYAPTIKFPPNLPAAPTNASVTRNSDTSHTVRWSNTSPGSSTAPYEKIQIMRWTKTGDAYVTIATLSGAPSSYTDKTTVPNQQYRYRIRAHNSAGAGGWDYTPYVSTTPAPPGTPKATKAANGDIKLTWSLDPVTMHRGVEVWLTKGGVDETSRHVLLPRDATSWTHANPDTTETWQYRLKVGVWSTASTEADYTLWSGFSGRSNTVQLLTNPLAPTELKPASTVMDGTQDIVLTWQHNPVDGTDQTAYQVQHRGQGPNDWTSTGKIDSTASSFTIPGGTYENGQTIEWRVQTWGLFPDPSIFSTSALVTLSTPPSATITMPEDGQVWNAAATGVVWEYYDPEGFPQSQWRARLLNDADIVIETQTGSGDSTGLFAFNTRLDDGATYHIEVELRDSTGLWSPPDRVTITVEYPLPPKPVVDAEWDHETASVAVTITNPEWDPETDRPTEYTELWRSIDGSQWVMIMDRLPENTTVTDYLPGLGGLNYYKAVAVSDLASRAESEPVEVDTHDHRWWVWVNAGPGFMQSVRIRDNAELQVGSGRAKKLHQFAGRRKPVEYVGEQRNRTINLSGRIAPESSEPFEFEDLADLPAPACIRTPDGQRYFVSVGDPSLTYRGMTAELSWSFTEIDHTEGVRTE